MLENAVFEDVDVQDLKVSVFAGPIFKRNDLRYRDVMVPKDYWKVIAYVDGADRQLKAKAFVLTQDDLLHDIEGLDLDPFRLYQVSLADLADRTRLDFDLTAAVDEMAPERVSEAMPRGAGGLPLREINAREDLILG